MKQTGTIRQHAKEAVRQRIGATALARFRAQGFQETTIDQIAADVGMSTRTFFRYFPSKEDVILDETRAFTDRVLAALEKSLVSETLWAALESALQSGLGDCRLTAGDGPDVERQELIWRTPALAGRQMQVIEALQTSVAELCLRAQPEHEAYDPPMMHAIVGTAFACLRASQHRDAHGSSEGPNDVLRSLMRSMKPAVLS